MTACSAPLTTLGGHGFNYCGDHWRLSKLPARFRINNSGAPSSVASNVGLAADLAAAAWDVASPMSGTGPRSGQCAQKIARVLCIESVGMSGGVQNEGVNTIVWQQLGTTGVAAYARIITSGHRIEDVDIVLNSSLSWYWSDPMLVSTGLALGPAAPFCPQFACPMRFDLQAILTHEFGHALGLLHVNPGTSNVWPSELGDAPDYNLVMYERYYPNNATWRVLGWGDVLGLQAVMLVSSQNP